MELGEIRKLMIEVTRASRVRVQAKEVCRGGCAGLIGV